MIPQKRWISEEEAYELAENFVKEIEQESDSEAIWWIIGSMARGHYRPGVSDVDLVVIPKKKGMYNAFYLMKKRDETQFPKVFKKGRYTSIIDPLIFVSTKLVKELRNEYNKKTK